MRELIATKATGKAIDIKVLLPELEARCREIPGVEDLALIDNQQSALNIAPVLTDPTQPDSCIESIPRALGSTPIHTLLLVDAIPRTEFGKVRRTEVRELFT